MSSANENADELSILLEETAQDVVDHYYLMFSNVLDQLGVSEDSGSFPPEVWTGLAQAVADASGYRVILQAAVLKVSSEAPNISERVAHRDVTIADPTLFIATD